MASILETFYILFKMNSSEIKKGLHESTEATNKFKESQKQAHEHVEKLGEKFKELASIFTDAIIGFTSAESVLENLKETQEYTNQLFELGEQLNVNTEELDAWGNAVKATGGNLQTLSGTLRGLDRNLSQNALRGPNQFTALLARVGISVRDANGNIKNSMQLLPQLASVFERLGKQQSKEFGLELGLDPATILLLQKGREEVEKAVAKQKELGVATKESQEISHAFTEQWNDTGNAFRKIFEMINDRLLPIFTEFLKMMEHFAVFLQKNPAVLVTALGALGGVLVALIIPAVTTLLPLLAAMLGLLSPWTIIIAAIGAGLGYLYSKLSDSGALEAFHNILDKIEHKIEAMVNLAHEVGQAFVDAAHWISDEWNKVANLVNKVVNAVENARDKVRGYLGLKTNDIAAGQQAINETSNVPIALQSSNIANNIQNNRQRSNKIYTGPITINTQATDANGIGSSLIDVLNDHYRQAINQHNDGVVI